MILSMTLVTSEYDIIYFSKYVLTTYAFMQDRKVSKYVVVLSLKNRREIERNISGVKYLIVFRSVQRYTNVCDSIVSYSQSFPRRLKNMTDFKLITYM